MRDGAGAMGAAKVTCIGNIDLDQPSVLDRLHHSYSEPMALDRGSAVPP